MKAIQNSFLANIFFLLAVNLLIKPFYLFAIERDVQNVVGAEVYGIYFTLLNLTLLLHIVNDFGIRNFTSRYIAQHTHLLQKYFPDLLAIKLMLSGLYLLSVFIVAYFLGYWQDYQLLLILLTLSRLLIGWIDFLRSIIIGLGKYRMDSWLSVLPRLVLLILGAILLWIPSLRMQFSIEWFVYAELTALLFSLAFAISILVPSLKSVVLNFQKQRIWVLLRQSLPYALIMFLMMIYSRIDAVMLEQLLPDGKKEVGIYAAAYRLLDAAIMFSYLFANLLLPMFAKLIKQKQSITILLHVSSQLLLAASITTATSVYFFRVPIMELLYVESTPYWGNILGILIWSFIAVSATHIFGTALLAKGNLKVLNWLFVGGILLNICLNAYFIPTHKAYAAAATTLATQSFIIIGEVVLTIRAFQLSLNQLFRKITFFASTYIGLSWLSLNALKMNWFIHFAVLIGLGIALAFIFQLLNWKAFQTVLLKRDNK